MKNTKNTESIHNLTNTLHDAESLHNAAFASQVAHMYYSLGLSQIEISEKLYCSRSKISRALTLAKELGIVNYQILRIPERITELEKKMKSIFGLDNVIIVTSYDDGGIETLETLTSFSALYVSSILHEGDIMGISFGNTVSKIGDKLSELNVHNIRAVQLVGSISTSYFASESRAIVNQLADVSEGRGYYLNVPIYISNSFAREQLLTSPSISDAYALMEKCNLILTGLGSFYPDNRTTKAIITESLTKECMDELSAKGAVGCVCARYYDINGKIIDCDWNEKVMSIPYQNIINNPNTIAATCGPTKILSVIGGIRAGFINTLIIDAYTATEVLKYIQREI